jgi:hypothetical protein
MQAYYFGALIPDAFYYNIIPWPRLPRKVPTITNILHQSDRTANNASAKKLLLAAAKNTEVQLLHVAFSAGVLTHTVSDGIYHGVIDLLLKDWNEPHTAVLGAHRQLETLFDMALWDATRPPLTAFPVGRHTRLPFNATHSLVQFFHFALISPTVPLEVTSVRALRWAFAQQLFLLRLFRWPRAFRPAQWARHVSRGRTDFISSLFYPSIISTETFPILRKIDVNDLSDNLSGNGDLNGNNKALAAYAVNAAVQTIQSVLA